MMLAVARINARTTEVAVKRLITRALSQLIDARVLRASLDSLALPSTANKRTPHTPTGSDWRCHACVTC